jgi:glucose-6-phosphate 1-dehydrogenase
VYYDGAYDQPEGFIKLREALDKSENDLGGIPGRLFYLALPPTVFPDVAAQIKANCMLGGGDKQSGGGGGACANCCLPGQSGGAVDCATAPWNRVVVEKPFGRDLASSEELAAKLGALFSEREVYRIDHYLGKELVQNLMTLRFANKLFSATWNSDHIGSVVIAFKEPFGTEGRGGYFDKYGIIRDILRNHLLQVFAIVAMEPPKDTSPESIRDEKTRVLEQTAPVVLKDTVVGQYRGNDKEKSYKEDDGVPDDSVTPTFATVVLHINNPRWKGVPFILKAGKALNERKAEIRIQYKAPSVGPIADPPRNELVMRLQPDEAIYCKINTKTPGLKNNMHETELDLTYGNRYDDVSIPDAYERLLLDVTRGDHQHFVRRDELVAAWKIFTPILHELENKRVQPVEYDFGTRGPKESDELIAKYGYRRSETYQWKK